MKLAEHCRLSFTQHNGWHHFHFIPVKGVVGSRQQLGTHQPRSTSHAAITTTPTTNTVTKAADSVQNSWFTHSSFYREVPALCNSDSRAFRRSTVKR